MQLERIASRNERIYLKEVAQTRFKVYYKATMSLESLELSGLEALDSMSNALKNVKVLLQQLGVQPGKKLAQIDSQISDPFDKSTYHLNLGNLLTCIVELVLKTEGKLSHCPQIFNDIRRVEEYLCKLKLVPDSHQNRAAESLLEKSDIEDKKKQSDGNKNGCPSSQDNYTLAKGEKKSLTPDRTKSKKRKTSSGNSPKDNAARKHSSGSLEEEGDQSHLQLSKKGKGDSSKTQSRSQSSPPSDQTTRTQNLELKRAPEPSNAFNGKSTTSKKKKKRSKETGSQGNDSP